MRKGLLSASLLCATAMYGAANIVIVNNDAAGVGSNDTTAVLPVGGNPGATLGNSN